MTIETVFSLCNLTATAGWVMLLAVPRSRRAMTIAGTVIPLLLAGVYLTLFAWHARGSQGGFSSLAGVAQLFGNPWLLLAGWVHYLAFDLLIGTWEVEDARRRGVRHFFVVPCLFLTFMFGPAGWLLYQGVRRVAGGRY